MTNSGEPMPYEGVVFVFCHQDKCIHFKKYELNDLLEDRSNNFEICFCCIYFERWNMFVEKS